MNLLELSRNGAVFIAVIVLLRLLLRRYVPRTAFVVLWLAAVVRLLCPVRIPSPVSIWRLVTRLAAAPKAGVIAARRFTGHTALPVRTALPNVCDLLGKVWLMGAVLLLLGIATLYFAGLREAYSATRLDCGAYLCKGLDSPRLCGIVRPRILLPESVGEEQLPFILLHERVHQRRLDNLWKLLALVAAALHWFNPAAWVLVALLGQDLEVSCDEWVLRGLDKEQRRAYALSLITMAQRPQRRSPIVCGFSQNPLEERIRYIMTNRKKSIFALSFATAMIVCTTSAFATNAPVAASPLEAADVDTVRYGVYNVKVEDEQKNNVVVSVTEAGEDSNLVTSFIGELKFFTAEEYEAYIEEQKVVMREEIAAGKLSQETYDMTIHDMEEVLAGIRDGSMMAAKPVESEDGSVTEYTFSTPDAANAAGVAVNYAVETDGTFSVTFNDLDPVS